MHSTLFANCLVSGVGGAMGVPVALLSGFPMGNMVLSHHFQVYTTIIFLCLVLVDLPLLSVLQTVDSGYPTILECALFVVGLGMPLLSIHNPLILLLSALCRLIGADASHSSNCIGATGVSPGVAVALQ